MKAQADKSLFVFSHDLRVDDHDLLRQACEKSQSMMCLYCLEPWMFTANWLTANEQTANHIGLARYRFWWESLHALNRQLKVHGQALVVQLGAASSVVSVLQTKHHFSHIYHSQSAGSYETQQWQQIKQQFPTVKLVSKHPGTLFELDDLPFAVQDLPPHFTPFKQAVKDLDILPPLSAPVHWPALVEGETNQLNQLIQPEKKQQAQSGSGFIGGSQAGQSHLHAYMNKGLPSSYKEVRNQLLGWDHSTKFSPWLALGCVTARQVMQELKIYETVHGANESTYWIYFELLWREFFHWHAVQMGPQIFHNTRPKSANHLRRQRWQQWCHGNTGVELVDACMRQLTQTGYLSNRGRQIAASFLLHEADVDWRWGASYFERMLIDYDVASNWGNWQYIAGDGTDPRGGRHFNLKKQQQTHDPEGLFVQQWSEHDLAITTISWHALLTR